MQNNTYSEWKEETNSVKKEGTRTVPAAYLFGDYGFVAVSSCQYYGSTVSEDIGIRRKWGELQPETEEDVYKRQVNIMRAL